MTKGNSESNCDNKCHNYYYVSSTIGISLSSVHTTA